MIAKTNLRHELLLPDIERLEKRRLLAGNVVATITGAGNLVINGDAGDNQIDVILGLGGEVSVVGHAGTVVDDDGLAGATLSGDVIINLKGGDDQVVLLGPENSNVFGLEKVTIIGGAGNDRLEVSELEFLHHKSAINSGSGNDRIYVRDSRAFGKLTISGGTGSDIIEIESTEFWDWNPTGAPGELSVAAGGGNDFVAVSDTEAEKLGVNLGGGSDAFDLFQSIVTGDTSVISGGGDDEMYVINSATGSSFFNSGAGEDALFFESSAVKYGENLTINTGGSDDFVNLNDTFVLGELKVTTGGGSDEVQFGDVTADSANVITGGGADKLTISLFTGSGTANGGAGFDVFVINVIGSSQISDLNFEDIQMPGVCV